MKRTVKIFIACGAGCILLLLLSSWYAVTFQQGRLVSPVRFEDYSFRVQDLPMILSLSLLSLYVVALFVALIAVGQGRLLRNPAYSLIALLIALSLVLALRLFLGEYLLYRYDHGKQDEE